MMLALAVIAFAVLVAGALFLFFWSVALTRSKRKRGQYLKPKRDEHIHLILSDDGELIDFPAWDAEDDYAQRSRYP